MIEAPSGNEAFAGHQRELAEDMPRVQGRLIATLTA